MLSSTYRVSELRILKALGGPDRIEVQRLQRKIFERSTLGEIASLHVAVAYTQGLLPLKDINEVIRQEACTHCEATGLSDEGRFTYQALGLLVCTWPCPHCYEEMICPRCGALLPGKVGNSEEDYCERCGWTYLEGFEELSERAE